ncbi:unnamed protein product [Moneuplotes crassus]|uniref:non-specific serine/threonine protein kinase n=1 Tax=Euplotes crassus TaxID=5936 RepID=A0AAD1XIG1_EUPCR|nr:unnamed protein product [Moneuplotes crassus]
MEEDLVAQYFEPVEEGYLEENFEILEEIGKGAFSKIYKIQEKKNDKIMAVKSIDKSKVKKLERVITEARFYSRFNDKSNPEEFKETEISKFVATQLHKPLHCPNYYYIFMQFYERGDLYQYCEAKQGLLEEEAKFVTRNLIEILMLLHQEGIVVRDIKPENCVIDDQGIIRLIDFNHVAFLEDSPDGKLYETTGTMGYMSPEVLKAKKSGYATEADIWCLGCLIYVILSGKLPFQGSEKISINAAILLNPIKYYKYWSKELKDVLSKIFINSPKHRITLKGILEHPWMEDFDQDWEDLAENSPLKNTSPNDLSQKLTLIDDSTSITLKKPTDEHHAKSKILSAIKIPTETPSKPDSEGQIYKREYSFG